MLGPGAEDVSFIDGIWKHVLESQHQSSEPLVDVVRHLSESWV